MPIKVLFADDSKTMRKVAEITFADSTEFILEITGDSHDAILKAEKIQPDIMIIDIDMPHINGYDICKKIKETQALRDIQVILMSGPSFPYDENKGNSVKTNAFIAKPFETSIMIGKIKELYETRAASPKVDGLIDDTQRITPVPIFGSLPDDKVSINQQKPQEKEKIDTLEFAKPSSIPSQPPVPPPVPQAALKLHPQISSPSDISIPKPPPPKPSEEDVTDSSKIPKRTILGQPALKVEIPSKFKDQKPEITSKSHLTHTISFESPVIKSLTPEIKKPEITPKKDEFPFKPSPEIKKTDVDNLAEFAKKEIKIKDDEFEFKSDKKFDEKSIEIDTEENIEIFKEKQMPVTAMNVKSPANIALTEENKTEIQKLTKEIIEQVVWEVVPELAEAIIKEEIQKLLKE